MLEPKIQSLVKDILKINPTDKFVSILDPQKLCDYLIDKLQYFNLFGSEQEKQNVRFLIWEIFHNKKRYLSSIKSLYVSKDQKRFTVPAINVRGLTYEFAQGIFETGIKLKTSSFIFEIAKSEMGYTDQSPEEFSSSIMAGAIKSNWTGPVFIQADHFQPGLDSGPIRSLIARSINAGFYNIDIDASVHVDLTKNLVVDQQIPNIAYTVDLIKFIRNIQPKNIDISIGAEIGHIGGKNSTPEDFEVFMNGLNAGLKENGIEGISKIAIQSGTSHGGNINKDGSVGKMNVDFDLIKQIGTMAKKKYNLGGVVQHGASTLSNDEFKKFPDVYTIEIHLATGFQNTILDSPQFPQDLRTKIYFWLEDKYKNEIEPKGTREQFYYKNRKKSWGQFKKEFWEINQDTKDLIKSELKEKLEVVFKKLNLTNNKKLISTNIKNPNL